MIEDLLIISAGFLLLSFVTAILAKIHCNRLANAVLLHKDE